MSTLLLLLAIVAGSSAQARVDRSTMEADVIRSGAVAVHGIEFQSGTPELLPASGRVLGEVLALLKTHDEWRFEVQVHSDTIQAGASGVALTGQQADAVVAWLTAHGIDAARLVAKGYGDTKPVADNVTPEGRARNRRVELKKLNEE